MSTSPTVVLVHGAFADASGYAGVIRELQSQGVPVRAPWNPLRGLASDADALVRYTSTIEGPTVLVGHSYGGAVITQAAPSVASARALVYLAAFAIDAGETWVETPRREGLAWPEELSRYAAEGARPLVRLPVRYLRLNDTFIWSAPVELFCEMAMVVRKVAVGQGLQDADAAEWVK